MKASDYQKEASRTSKINWDNQHGPDIAILGVIGEIGSLASVIKKQQRDAEAYSHYEEDFIEEAGDILWYVTTISTRLKASLDEWPATIPVFSDAFEGLYSLHDKIILFSKEQATLQAPADSDRERLSPLIQSILSDLAGLLKLHELTLEKVADLSCNKILSYWCHFEDMPARQFDSDFPWYEQLPRKFTIDFISINNNKSLILSMNNMLVGDRLTDNSYEIDGYKFHDIFHLAGAVTLGWSPVFRRMLKLKRKSNSKVDEVEDGARAAIVEEAVINHIYDYARPKFLEGMSRVDLDLIKRIQNLVRGYEVEACEPWEWQHCILSSYEMFRQLIANKGGRIVFDADKRSMTFEPLEPQ